MRVVPSEKETLVSRLIDRPLRPLFPKGFLNEVQVIATVISVDPQIDSDIPAILGASAAVALTGAPFMGPIGAARVGYIDDKFVLNPSAAQLATSKLDLVVAGTSKAVLMVESSANQLPETVMLDAVMFGHAQMQVAIEAIRELAAEAGKPVWDWQPPASNPELAAAVAAAVGDQFAVAYRIHDKQLRYGEVARIKEQTIAALLVEGGPTQRRDRRGTFPA